MCGATVDAAARQCPKCNAALGAAGRPATEPSATMRINKCPRCGAQVQQGDVICVSCGTNLFTGKRVTVSSASSEIRSGLTISDTKRWIWAGAAVVVLVVLVAAIFVFARDYTALGKKLVSEGKYEQGIDALRTAIDRNDSDFDAHFYMGVAQSLMDNYDDAARAFDQAARLKPQSLEAHLLLGLTHGIRGDYEKELDELDYVIDLDPNHPNHVDALFLAALAYGVVGDAGNEISYLERAEALRPRDASIHYYLGMALSRQEMYEQAVTAFERALAIDPYSGDTLLALGMSYEAGGAVDKALAALRDALARQTQFIHNAHYHLGLALAATERWQDAREEFARALESSPNNAACLYFLGVAEQTLGNSEAASNAFRRIIDLGDAEYGPQAHIQMALIKIRQGEKAQGEDELRTAVAAQPANVAAHIHLGMFLKDEGRDAAAIRAFRTAIDAAPNNPAPHLALAVFYVERKSTEYAVKEFQKYLDLVPSGGESESVRRIVRQLEQSAQG